MTTMMMAGAVVKSGNVDEASIMVEYNANDVNTDEGRAIVENRIRLAASQICGPTRYILNKFIGTSFQTFRSLHDT